MIWFFVGIAAGFGIGAIAMALATIASQADDYMEKLYDRCGKEKLNKGIKTDIDRKNMR